MVPAAFAVTAVSTMATNGATTADATAAAAQSLRSSRVMLGVDGSAPKIRGYPADASPAQFCEVAITLSGRCLKHVTGSVKVVMDDINMYLKGVEAW